MSIVEPGTRLGAVKRGNDVVFEIVWGSNVWRNGYSISDSSHTFFSIQHEISHLLTLAALQGNVEGIRPESTTSISQVLGRSMWEGLADCISGRLRFIGNDELYRNMNIGFNPKQSFFEQQQRRSLGCTTNYINELCTSLLCRAWLNSGNFEGIEHIQPATATRAFIKAVSGRRKEVPDDAENGWLVKQIFLETGCDVQKVLAQIRASSLRQAETILQALLPDKLQSDLRNRLVQEFVQTAPNWDPFGEDSLI